jgi:NADPH:quinone reductase
MLREMVGHDFPVVLGRDYAGTVEAIGADVDGYAVGDEVFGFVLHANPTVHEGSWAELIALTPEMQVAPKPASLDLAAAGVARSLASPHSRPSTRSRSPRAKPS